MRTGRPTDAAFLRNSYGVVTQAGGINGRVAYKVGLTRGSPSISSSIQRTPRYFSDYPGADNYGFPTHIESGFRRLVFRGKDRTNGKQRDLDCFRCFFSFRRPSSSY